MPFDSPGALLHGQPSVTRRCGSAAESSSRAWLMLAWGLRRHRRRAEALAAPALDNASSLFLEAGRKGVGTSSILFSLPPKHLTAMFHCLYSNFQEEHKWTSRKDCQEVKKERGLSRSQGGKTIKKEQRLSRTQGGKTIKKEQRLSRSQEAAKAVKKKQKNRMSDYVLRPGERGTPFTRFAKAISEDIMNDELPKGQISKPGAPQIAMLELQAQQLFFNVTNMVIDIIESGSCIEDLDEDMVEITEYFELPRLNVNSLKPKTDEGVKKTLKDLAGTLHRVALASSPLYGANQAVNPEFKDLLKILTNYKQGDDLFLIRFPACYCPLANRGYLFVTYYDYTMDVLRFSDQQAYNHVMTGLNYPPDWDVRLQDNTNLVKHFNKGEYDPRAKNKGTDPRLEPHRYHRNGHAHPYQGTSHPNAPHGMTWTKEDMARAFYYLFPRVTSSFQICLSFIGELRHLKTQHLFAYCIEKNKPY